MLQHAKLIATDCVQTMCEKGHFIGFPIVNMKWLYRFRIDHGIVLRQPNRRYKVSWEVACNRCCADWLNNIRVRRMAEHFLGSDLADRIFGVDEKPLHYNESGSKAVKTLELEGAPHVSLRTNHSASRERLTIVTMVASWRALAQCNRKPPLAICARAGSGHKTEKIKLPDLTRISLDWSPSGS